MVQKILILLHSEKQLLKGFSFLLESGYLVKGTCFLIIIFEKLLSRSFYDMHSVYLKERVVYFAKTSNHANDHWNVNAADPFYGITDKLS
jgi:hypothetical protein